MPTSLPRSVRLVFAMLILVLLATPLLQPAPARAAAILLDETFTGTVTNGPWLLGAGGASDGACLTAGGALGCATASGGGQNGTLPDAAGGGALRLTNNKNEQAGFAISGTVIPAGSGLDISFDYFAYGGNGADGLTFFLIDGSANPTLAGAFGGSLGYAQRNGVPGLVGGYIGLGIDEFGNFANGAEGRGVGCPAVTPGAPGSTGLTGGPGPIYPDYVTIRGAMGSSGGIPDANQGYCYITSAAVGSSLDTPFVTNRAGTTRQTVRVILSPSNLLRLLINGAEVIAPIDLNSVPSQPAFPAGFRIGFAGSTGGSTNYHEIQNLKVTALNPDLTIVKRHSGDFTVGQEATYTLEVSNAIGAGPALGPISVSDPLPVGLDFVSATGNNWNCAFAGGVVHCDYTALPVKPGDTLPLITLKARVTGAAPALLENTAQVTTPDDGNPGDNSSTDRARVILVADLAITKQHAAPDPHPGEPIIYTLVVTNNGPSAVKGASVQDSVPSVISNVTWGCAAGIGAACGAASGTGNMIATTVDLPSGAIATITVQGLIAKSATGELVNTATVAPPSGTTDPNPGNNSSTDRFTLKTGGTTAIALASFTASREGQRAIVRWVTSAEIGTRGYHLWRGTTPERAAAQRITTALVPATGRGAGGASYEWADTTAAAATTYYYWLEEVETGGATSDYGPALMRAITATSFTLYLPVVTSQQK